MKKLRYGFEAGLLLMLFALLRHLPLSWASAFGGLAGRAIGPFFSADRVAKANISRTFPDWPNHRVQKTVTQMWDHLGRVGAEMSRIADDTLLNQTEIVGWEHVPQDGKPVMFFSGHLGNWEILPQVSKKMGLSVGIVYRKTNNPYVDRIIAKLRTPHTNGLFVKGTKGAVELIRAIKRGQSIAMLVDQKLNTGISIPFLGREAMTATAAAEFILKYDMHLIPARVTRLGGATFRSDILPPINITRTGDHEADIRRITMDINAQLERWIRETPEQWFWVHQRWPKE